MQTGGDQAPDMGDVGHDQRPDLVGDDPELLIIDGPGIGAGAHDDDLRPMLLGQGLHLVEVDGFGFPIDAVLAVPTDRKSRVLLRGRYEEEGTAVQMLVPSLVVNEVLETMFSVRNYVILGSAGVGGATLMTAALVFVLSIRLRRREIETIRKTGGSSRRLTGMLAAEILLVVFAGIVIAGVLTAGVSRFGNLLVRFIGT